MGLSNLLQAPTFLPSGGKAAVPTGDDAGCGSERDTLVKREIFSSSGNRASIPQSYPSRYIECAIEVLNMKLVRKYIISFINYVPPWIYTDTKFQCQEKMR
jgi:hypothetical protein